MSRYLTCVATASLLMVASSTFADTQNASNSNGMAVSRQSEPLSLAAFNQPEDRAGRSGSEDLSLNEDSTTSESSESTMESRRLTEDDVAARQSVDAYNSLEDGQPGDPGSIEIQLETGWQTTSGEHDPVFWNTEIQFNPDGCEFLRNSQFTLGVPLELGLGGVDGNADIDLGWQQRWVKENGNIPTIATLAEIRLPSGYHSSGVDGTLTGIIAKDVGPGTAYFNAFAKSANGNNIEDVRHFQWGFRTGYKWRISDEFAMIGDYVHQSSEEEGHAK